MVDSLHAKLRRLIASPLFLLVTSTLLILALSWVIPSSASHLANTTLVSVAEDGSQGLDESWKSSVSADGQQVAFMTRAWNISGFFNPQIVVRDLEADAVKTVNLTNSGDSMYLLSSETFEISENGRYVVFYSSDDAFSGDTDTHFDIFVRDLETDQTAWVSVNNEGMEADEAGSSTSPAINENGQYIAFSSGEELAPGADPFQREVFVRDRGAETTELITWPATIDGIDIDPGNAFAKDISDDGNEVLFENGSQYYLRHRDTDATVLVSRGADGEPFEPNYPDDEDVGDGRLSGNGRYFVFELSQPDTPDHIYIRDLDEGTVDLVSTSTDGTPGDAGSYDPRISSDGRFISFYSDATNLVPGDTNATGDIFVRDQFTGTTLRVTWRNSGEQLQAGWLGRLAGAPDISADGQYVSMASESENIVASDSNGYEDVFLRNRGDIQGPAIENLTLNPNPAEVTEDVQLTATASDDGGHNVASAEYRVDDGEWQPLGATDGSYDSSSEEVEATIPSSTFTPLFAVEEIFTICVRSTDADGNRNTECAELTVRDSSVSTTNLRIRCLSNPVWAQPEEDVTFQVRAFDSNLNPVEVDELEIYVNDRTTPAATDTNDDRLATVRPFGSTQTVFYGCRIKDGDAVLFSGWRGTSVGDTLNEPVVPVLSTGVHQRKIDIGFIADEDDYSGPADPDFISGVTEAIREGFHKQDIFLRNQDMFNFWIIQGTGAANRTGPDPNQGTCVLTTPDGWNQDFAFIDSGAILHTETFRDCARLNKRVFSTEPSSYGTVRHETGHQPFGLADEYCHKRPGSNDDSCDGGYFQADPNPNLYRTRQACEEDAPNLGRTADDCQEFVGDGVLFFGEKWFVSDPPDSDMMVDRGPAQAADIRRIEWLFSRCDVGEC